MYVCVCNALTERRIAEAVDSGVSGPVHSVYDRVGVTPSCGKCAASIRQILRRRRGVSPAAAAAAE